MSNVQKISQCSFCGKNQHQVPKLISGPAVFICSECIELCSDICSELQLEAAIPLPTEAELGRLGVTADKVLRDMFGIIVPTSLCPLNVVAFKKLFASATMMLVRLLRSQEECGGARATDPDVLGRHIDVLRGYLTALERQREVIKGEVKAS